MSSPQAFVLEESLKFWATICPTSFLTGKGILASRVSRKRAAGIGFT